MKHILMSLLLMTGAGPALAEGFSFASIDGGEIVLDAYRGQPILVVNTASRCGFTKQYEALQTLHETYGPRGLVVLAVPSNDFKQELANGEAVKEFCELNYNLTLPMTEITKVTGADAHPFYAWLKAEHGFKPRWNFYKVLIGPDGGVLGTFSSPVRPDSRRIARLLQSHLSQ